MEETGKIPVLLLAMGGIGCTMGWMFEAKALISAGIVLGTISVSIYIFHWVTRN